MPPIWNPSDSTAEEPIATEAAAAESCSLTDAADDDDATGPAELLASLPGDLAHPDLRVDYDPKRPKGVRRSLVLRPGISAQCSKPVILAVLCGRIQSSDAEMPLDQSFYAFQYRDLGSSVLADPRHHAWALSNQPVKGTTASCFVQVVDVPFSLDEVVLNCSIACLILAGPFSGPRREVTWVYGASRTECDYQFGTGLRSPSHVEADDVWAFLRSLGLCSRQASLALLRFGVPMDDVTADAARRVHSSSKRFPRRCCRRHPPRRCCRWQDHQQAHF